MNFRRGLFDGFCGVGPPRWIVAPPCRLLIKFRPLQIKWLFSTGDSYVVDPLQSSPVIQFESPVRGVERIVGNTRDSLILEGMEYGPKDPNCCPSIKVRFTLRVDEKGNWKLVEKKTLPAKKYRPNPSFHRTCAKSHAVR